MRFVNASKEMTAEFKASEGEELVFLVNGLPAFLLKPVSMADFIYRPKSEQAEVKVRRKRRTKEEIEAESKADAKK